MKSKLVWIVFLLLLFVSSYYRELLFRSINAIIEGEDLFYAKTTRIEFIEEWTKSELMKLKYFLTVSFSILFILLTSLGLYFSFYLKTPLLLSLSAYLLIIITAAATAIIGSMISSFNEVYPTLRMLVGWIHNPLLYLLISIGSIGYNSLKESSGSSKTFR